jgi:hypothetical protein
VISRVGEEKYLTFQKRMNAWGFDKSGASSNTPNPEVAAAMNTLVNSDNYR